LRLDNVGDTKKFTEDDAKAIKRSGDLTKMTLKLNPTTTKPLGRFAKGDAGAEERSSDLRSATTGTPRRSRDPTTVTPEQRAGPVKYINTRLVYQSVEYKYDEDLVRAMICSC
jgi:hypothetical protein